MGSEHIRLPETVSENKYKTLTLRDDDRNNLTIGTVLNLDKRSSPGIRSGRTLVDIIQAGESKITWRNFHDKLRLKRASTAIQGANSLNNQMILSDPDRIRSSSSSSQTSLSPIKMSLMSLLAETDREMGIDSAYVMEDHEVENDASGNVEGGEFNDCCVCMERHKGSAFIPCGHTFCRLCSRELYVHCPICNGFILEILDIF